MPDTRSAMPHHGHKRLGFNLSASIASYLFSIFVGLWLTPYLIGSLGVAAYGLIPLATTVTSYLAIFTLGLNGAVGRYLTISLDGGDAQEANRIFNTSLVSTVTFVLVVTPLTILLGPYVDSFFNVPPGYSSQFVWLFYATVAAFMLATLGSSFGLACYCRNRFELSNGLSMMSNVVRIVTIVLLFTLLAPAIWQVGVSMVVAGLVGVAGSVVLWRKLTPELHLRLRDFRLGTLRQITGTSTWFVVSQVGTILYLSIDLVVVNKVLGAEAGGRYAAVLTWSTLLRGLATAIAGVLGPTMLVLYARGDLDGLALYSKKSVRLLGLAIGLPVGLICGFSAPLLTLWLGPEARSLATLMMVMTIHLAVNLSVLPMFGIMVATNSVRTPGVVTCAMGVANLGLALLLAGPMDLGMIGVALAGAIMLMAKNLLFTPVYAARCLNRPSGAFYGDILPTVLATLGLTLICWIIARFVPIDSWLELVAVGSVPSVMYLAVTWLLVLSSEERDTARGLIRKQRLGAGGLHRNQTDGNGDQRP